MDFADYFNCISNNDPRKRLRKNFQLLLNNQKKYFNLSSDINAL